MFTRDFAAEETDEGFNVTYSDDPEPIFVAKYRLDPDVAAQIRSRVVPNDAPGHAFGFVAPLAMPVALANALPPAPMTQEEQDAAIAAQAAYTQASLANEPTPEIGPQELAGPPAPATTQQPAPPARFEAPFDLGEGTPSTRAGTSAANRLPSATPIEFDPMKRTGDGSVVLTPEQALAAAGEGPPPVDVPLPAPGYRPPAGAAPPAPAGVGQRSGSRVGVSSKRPGDSSDVEFKPTEMPVDPAEEGRLSDAALLAELKGDVAMKEAADLAAIAAETAESEARMKADYEAMVLQHNTDADRMFQDIVAGKVDPNRMYANMDTGQRIGTIIGLILGGMGKAAAGGDNPVLTALNREIDRDVALQRDALDRKESAYRMFREQGKDDVEAWKLSKAAALDVAAAKMDAASKRYGSEDARLSAQQAVLKLRTDAAALRTQALGADYMKQLETFKTVQHAKSEAAKAKATADGVRIDAFNANTNRMRAEREGMGTGGDGTPGKNPPMEIAPGVIVQPSDATSRQNLEKAVDAFNTMRNLIVDARAHRARAGAQLIPRTADYVKADRLEKQLITALNNVENLGAFDKGTADLLGDIVPKIGGVYTPKVVDESLADLLNLATKKFQSKIMTNVVPGTGLVNFTGAQGDFKPVGKAD